MSILNGTPAIAKLFSVATKTANLWSNEPDFPRPVSGTGRFRKWDAHEVEEWVHEHCERTATYGLWKRKRSDRDGTEDQP